MPLSSGGPEIGETPLPPSDNRDGDDHIGTSSTDRWRRLPDAIHYAIVVAICAAVRVASWSFGGGFKDDPATAIYGLQLLDPRHLADDPFLAFTDNHIQPPLWNFFVGSVLRWSPLSSTTSFQLLFAGAGLVTVCLLWSVLRDLKAPRWIATTASVLVGVNPLMIMRERIPMYEPLVTLFVMFAVWSCARYFRSPTVARLGLFALALILGAWTRTTLSPLWVFAALVFVLVVRRPPVRRVAHVAVAVTALLVLSVPSVHNWFRFGTLGTSSYMGMNWEHSAVQQLPESDLHRLVDEGRLSPAALVLPFSHYEEYAPLFPPCRPDTGRPVLDRFEKPNGQPNMNNICYLGPARQATRDAWAAVRAEPGKYAVTVARSTMLFSSWGVQKPLLGSGLLRDYAGFYQPLVLPVHVEYDWGFGDPQQPYMASAEDLLFLGQQPFSMTVAVALVVAFVLAARGTWRLIRGRNTPADLIRVFIGGTVFAVMVPSVLFDNFENPRFREPLDPILLGPLFALVLQTIVGVVQRYRDGREVSSAPIAPSGSDGVSA